MVFTYNEGLQRRLLSFAEQHPENCRFESQNNEGEMIFEIDKGRLSIHLTAPYKENWCQTSLSQNGKNKVHRCLVIS